MPVLSVTVTQTSPLLIRGEGNKERKIEMKTPRNVLLLYASRIKAITASLTIQTFGWLCENPIKT